MEETVSTTGFCECKLFTRGVDIVVFVPTIRRLLIVSFGIPAETGLRLDESVGCLGVELFKVDVEVLDLEEFLEVDCAFLDFDFLRFFPTFLCCLCGSVAFAQCFEF